MSQAYLDIVPDEKVSGLKACVTATLVSLIQTASDAQCVHANGREFILHDVHGMMDIFQLTLDDVREYAADELDEADISDRADDFRRTFAELEEIIKVVGPTCFSRDGDSPA